MNDHVYLLHVDNINNGERIPEDCSNQTHVKRISYFFLNDDEYFPLWCCEYYISFFVHTKRTLSIEVDIFHALRWTMWTCFYAFMSSPHPPLLSEPLGTLVNCLLPHCQEKAAICIISCTYSVSQTKPCYNLHLPWTLQRGKRPRCGGKYSLEECPRKDKGTWVRTRLMSEILF